MTDGPLRKSLARAVVDGLELKPCTAEREDRILKLVVQALEELERYSELPRQNPGMCGTKHPWIQSTWQYGGRGEPLCSECSHIEGGNCHQPLYNDMLGGCSWCGSLTGGRHKSNCLFMQAETMPGSSWLPERHGPKIETGRLSIKEPNLSNLPQCCPVDCWIAHEHTLSVAPRYWEDVVVERVQAKLPPGHTARLVREAPLRDKDGRVQMRDSRDVLYATYKDIPDFEHEVIKLAWKRFLDRGY